MIKYFVERNKISKGEIITIHTVDYLACPTGQAPPTAMAAILSPVAHALSLDKQLHGAHRKIFFFGIARPMYPGL